MTHNPHLVRRAQHETAWVDGEPDTATLMEFLTTLDAMERAASQHPSRRPITYHPEGLATATITDTTGRVIWQGPEAPQHPSQRLHGTYDHSLTPRAPLAVDSQADEAPESTTDLTHPGLDVAELLRWCQVQDDPARAAREAGTTLTDLHLIAGPRMRDEAPEDLQDDVAEAMGEIPDLPEGWEEAAARAHAFREAVRPGSGGQRAIALGDARLAEAQRLVAAASIPGLQP